MIFLHKEQHEWTNEFCYRQDDLFIQVSMDFFPSLLLQTDEGNSALNFSA